MKTLDKHRVFSSYELLIYLNVDNLILKTRVQVVRLYDTNIQCCANQNCFLVKIWMLQYGNWVWEKWKQLKLKTQSNEAQDLWLWIFSWILNCRVEKTLNLLKFNINFSKTFDKINNFYVKLVFYVKPWWKIMPQV